MTNNEKNGIISFEELRDSSLRTSIREVPGFYKVYMPKDFEMIIAENTLANPKCYRNHEQMKKEYLESLWADLQKYNAQKDRLLYIGKGINLRNRLNLYMRVMFKNATNHSGGVYICQIENCNQLEVEWTIHESENVSIFLNTPKDERKQGSEIYDKVNSELLSLEHSMIQEYKNSHGGLFPFANREN